VIRLVGWLIAHNDPAAWRSGGISTATTLSSVMSFISLKFQRKRVAIAPNRKLAAAILTVYYFSLFFLLLYLP